MSGRTHGFICLLLVSLGIVLFPGFSRLVEAAVVESTVLYAQDFDSFEPAGDPTDWLDTAAQNSMVVDDSLFKVADLSGNRVFHTSSTSANIHAHYAGSGSASFANFVYSGRMMMSAANSGIGVTFLSDYNQSDSYYRLRRFGNGGSFHLSPHGTSISGGATNSGVVPLVNVWYRFRIEVEDTGSQTNIRARVWEEGTAEPDTWQINAYDSSSSRRTVGTIGVWSYESGSKYWDDFSVSTLSSGPFALTVESNGNGHVIMDPDQTAYSAGEVVTLTAVPDAGWQFDGWSGDLAGSTNPATLIMSADKAVTATFSGVPTYTLTTNGSGNGAVVVDPQQSSYEAGTVVNVTAIGDTGWRFTGWSGDLTGGDNPASLTMDADKSVTATFVEDAPLTLTVNTIGSGSTVTSPSKPAYTYGETILVTATAAPGWRFDSWQSDPALGGGWWNAQWDYRLPLTVYAAGHPRSDAPAEVELNFTQAWNNLGVNGALDPNSLRVIEVDGSGAIIDTAVPFQFDPAATFDAGTNAAGSLVLLLTGSMAPTDSRTYHVYFDVTGKSFTPAAVTPLVTLTDGVTDEGLTTYRIGSNAATYYYDKNGGGFSSMVDVAGIDWLNYNTSFGSSGTYRGIPNLVYPEGYMHPGSTNVASAVVHQGPLKSTIRSISTDEQWETVWEIYPDFARLTVLRINHNYWFLYEGTPGGTLELDNDVVMRSDGGQTLAGEAWALDLAGEEWVCFGDPNVARSLCIANHEQDAAVDSYYAMEGAMTVFGFGRQGLTSFLSAAPASFTVAFVEGTDYSAVAGAMQGVYQPPTLSPAAAETRVGAGSIQDSELTFDITSNQVVTATFTELISPTLNIATAGSGSVMVEPDLPQYDYGQKITVTATADSGWSFSGWSGDQTGSSNPLLFSITEDTSITANFAELVPLTLSVSTTGNGTVQIDPEQASYTNGQVVTLSAVAAGDWTFAGWSGDASGSSNPLAVAMDSDKFVTATFVEATGEAPSINVWHGAQQRYRHIGLPQPWFNILGNVSDPDGVVALAYRLNGDAPVTLSIGPDDRRLAKPGDFNVDLNYQDLLVGENEVIITATDALGHQTTETVTVFYDESTVWPTPYSVDWSTVAKTEDVAQVVDGKWAISGAGLRIMQPEYDRLVAIGDIGWTDYEVTVPITIHEVDFANSGGVSGAPGLGLLMRWQGHTDNPIAGWQPKTGWAPHGAIGWWRWSSSTDADLVIYESGQRQDFTPQLETAYLFKMRVESTPGLGGLYRIKVWEEGQPEPAGWNVSHQEGSTDVANGSFLLLAHHVDATFGDVTVTALGHAATTLDVSVSGSGAVTTDPDKAEYAYGESVTLTALPADGWIFTGWQGDLSGTANPAALTMDGSKQVTATFVAETAPPVISGVTVTPYADAAIVSWNTDKPASSEVAYGESSGYELGTATDSTLKTSHAVTLSGLIANTVYHYQISTVDGNGNSSSTGDATFTTLDDSVSEVFTSDDFNSCSLNTSLWSYLDPIADGSMSLSGTQLRLTVPAGTNHDVWSGGNMAPRLMQPAADTDFELEVKFESTVSEQYEMQGIIVEQDANNFLRFDFYGDNGRVNVFAARFVNGSPAAVANVGIGSAGAPMYMRITRTGDSWTQAYSLDGANWTTTASFAHALAVSQVGVFAGNAGSSPPAHTAVVDYFFNTASPVVPEDGDGGLTCN